MVARVQDEAEPLPSRRPMMEPIPEASPRPSDDLVRKLERPRTLSTRPIEPVILEEEIPTLQYDQIRTLSESTWLPTPPPEPEFITPVQRSVSISSETPSRVLTFLPARSPTPPPELQFIESVQLVAPTLLTSSARTPSQPLQVATGIPTPPRTPTPPRDLMLPPQEPTLSAKEYTTPLEPIKSPATATGPVQRSITLPHEEPQQAPIISPERSGAKSELESVSRKPSLIKRIKSTFRNKVEDAEAAEESGEKAITEPNRMSTPPPRVATLPPPPSRKPTASVPS